MVKAIVAGAAGRMGSRLVALIHGEEGIELVGGLERPGHPCIGQDLGALCGLGHLGFPLRDDEGEDGQALIGEADVLIEFTAPPAALRHLGQAVAAGKAMVIGTTGFSAEQRREIAEQARAIPCLLSPNMSVGINVLFKVLGEMARTLGADYQIELTEAHHRFKEDAPSGTALRMAEILAGARGQNLEEVAVFGRRGVIGPRSAEEIGIQVIRAGDIVGDHTVVFAGAGERIEITHRAHSRDNFARGAILAAKWIVHQPRGLYDLQDLLGLK